MRRSEERTQLWEDLIIGPSDPTPNTRNKAKTKTKTKTTFHSIQVCPSMVQDSYRRLAFVVHNPYPDTRHTC